MSSGSQNEKEETYFSLSDCKQTTKPFSNSTTSEERNICTSLQFLLLRVGFTFAFRAFLTPPLEPAPDQAVKGAQILCAIGQKGHGFQHP